MQNYFHGKLWNRKTPSNSFIRRYYWALCWYLLKQIMVREHQNKTPPLHEITHWTQQKWLELPLWLSVQILYDSSQRNSIHWLVYIFNSEYQCRSISQCYLQWIQYWSGLETQGKQANKIKPIKAIHVETEKSKGQSIMEVIMKCYGRSFETTRNFPNGMCLYFCKNLDNAAYKMGKNWLI